MVAIVTGATRGIGLGIAKALVAAGYTVIGSYTSEYTQDKIAAITEGKFDLIRADISSPEDCDLLVKKALEKEGRIDVLVNNAGITKDTLLMRMSESDFDQVINVNLMGTFNMTKAVTRPMMKQKYGRMINISSIIGIVGNAGQANYSASKAGIIGFTKSIAKEIGSRNITVNCVAPGFIETDMTADLSEDLKQDMLKQIAVKRLGKVEDIANAVVFLASKETSYITGQVINVCGGFVM